jgi:hypothetical protein
MEDGKTIRGYPNPSIAASHNPTWSSDIKNINCADYTTGSALGYKPVTGLNTGDSVRCKNESDTKIFRYMGNNTIRHYPTGGIAASWNSNWNKNIKDVAHCGALTQGAQLKINPKPGDSVQCGGTGGVLRVMEDGKTVRGYPNPPIAASWNSNWASDIKDIECGLYTMGSALGMNPDFKPNDLTDAQAQCYLNKYRDLRVAFGHDNIGSAKQHWRDYGRGEGRDWKCDNDPGKQYDTIPVGKAIRCHSGTGNAATYRWMGNKTIRGYPSEGVADSWDSNWRRDYTHVNCNEVTIGGNLKTKPNRGDSVRCSAGSPAIFRVIDENTIRGYPNPGIAASWNRRWDSGIKDIECGLYTTGPNLGTKLTTGESIKCTTDGDKVYRAMDSTTLRHYPTPDIASSWNRNWGRTRTIDCGHITKGAPLGMKA